MDFTSRGTIRIEDKGDEGEVLGLATALGDNKLEEFGQAEVDTTPRDLDLKETVAAIHGLSRMALADSMPFSVVMGLINRNHVGDHGIKAFYVHGGSAINYLEQIALHGVQQAETAS